MSFDNFSLQNMSIFADDHQMEFNFCSVMEPGASSDSPADHIFSNGRLVPHDFPCSKALNPPSRSASCSNDGFESWSSSRSDSCSSSQRSGSSGTSSSASTSDVNLETRALVRARRPKSSTTKHAPECTYNKRKHIPTVESGSRKWQFIAAAPVLNNNVLHQTGRVSQRRKSEFVDPKVSKVKKEGKNNGCWRRFFCLFVSACNEFHAIEPSAFK